MQKSKHELFEKRILDLVGSEYEILSIFESRKKKVEFKHNLCGHIFFMSPGNFYKGDRCPSCGNKRKGQYHKSTHAKLKKEISKLVGDEYTLLDDIQYENSFSHVLIQHNSCGHKYKVSPNNFKRGRRCPKCFGTNKKTTQIFKDEVYDKVGEEYSVLGRYKNYKTKILMKHNTCNHEYYVTPSHFLSSNCRCPKCMLKRTSIAENNIEKVFKKSNISYLRNFKLDNCLSNERKIPLTFDYFLKDFNCFIEIDGEQHFAPKYNEDVKTFLKRATNDQIRNSYFRNNKNFIFIRIPFTIPYDLLYNIINEIIRKKFILEKEFIFQYHLLYSHKEKKYNYKSYYKHINSAYFSLLQKGSTTIETT